ncbi:MAG TPA: hypothetical protein VI653_02455, partial [Steroidobacteraceae bacterium]
DCANPPSCTQAAFHIKAKLTTYIAPNTTFHVVRTDKSGKLLPASADFVYASPPQPQEPGSFTATEPQFGQVSLTWSTVQNVTGYLVNEKGSTAPPAQVPAQSTAYQSATLFKNLSPGFHTYQIASAYGYPVPAVGLPEASVLVHAVPPPHSVPFLTKNNGAGSEAAYRAHIGRIAQVVRHYDPANLALQDLSKALDEGVVRAVQVPAALYANVTDLGLGRSVACWEWWWHGNLTAIDCLASNHGLPPGAATPNLPELIAATSARSAASVGWIHFAVGSREMTFMNFLPANGAGVFSNPLVTGNWDGWKSSSSTTLDDEGAKYLPHACLTCHGGTYDASTNVVTGATFLPVDPAQVAFSNQPGSDRGSSEAAIRAINASIVDAKPPQAVADYISGLYNGNVTTPGTIAQSSYVPPGWAQQADLFKNVVKPDCLMCHLASPPSLVFDSADKFFANKAAIYADVCVAHSMPNAQVPYNHLWSSLGPSGSVKDGPAAVLMAALGYNSCP